MASRRRRHVVVVVVVVVVVSWSYMIRSEDFRCL